MQPDPNQEWQRLAGHYRSMLDGELLELALDLTSLTEPAQQALRGEMLRRGLGEPESVSQAPPVNEPLAGSPLRLPSESAAGHPSTGLGFMGGDLELAPATDGGGDQQEVHHEFTWKTQLCECETYQTAWQISEALRRAGIQSWIEKPGGYAVSAVTDVTNLRLLVAADQFDQACTVAAQPIPQEIVEASEMKVPEFEAPKCPQCGADDPVLENVDPVNKWLCELCGAEWTESAEDIDGQEPESDEDAL
jgi:hypothetical protein